MKRITHIQRAFTLIEILVVVAIIVVLSMLLVTAATALIERNEVQSTQNTIRLVDMAYDEWRLLSEREVTYGTGAQMQDGFYNAHMHTTTELLRILNRNRAIRDITSKIPPDRMRPYQVGGGVPVWFQQYDSATDPDFRTSQLIINNYQGGSGSLNGVAFNGSSTILDAWDTPVRSIHAGASYEEDYGPIRDGRMLFVSAGPDRRFGKRTSQVGSALWNYTIDNVYSYPVE